LHTAASHDEDELEDGKGTRSRSEDEWPLAAGGRSNYHQEINPGIWYDARDWLGEDGNGEARQVPCRPCIKSRLGIGLT
jgi:hypothetical protein